MAFNFSDFLNCGNRNTTMVPEMGIIKRIHEPKTTGASVIGIKFKNGVMIAADMLGSFGSLARFRSLNRVLDINKQIVLGAGGDYGDFQYMCSKIKPLATHDVCVDDGHILKPKSLHSWITQVLYLRRSKFDPLWLNIVVGGLEDGKPYLATVDKIGTSYENDCVATGNGAVLTLPILRNATHDICNLTEQEAAKIIKTCMQVLFYRDARSYEKYQTGTVTEEGAKVSEPITVDTNWDVAKYVSGYE